MTGVRGPLYGSIGGIILVMALPASVVVEALALAGSHQTQDLIVAPIAVILSMFVCQWMVVVTVDADEVAITLRSPMLGLYRTTRAIPWSNIERLEGSWYRARVVQASDGKKVTVAAYDPRWSRRRTVRAINDHLANFPAHTAA